MTVSRLVEIVSDLVMVYAWALMAGLVVGMAVAWWVGLAVGVGVAAVLYGVERAAGALVRKARQTGVTQRRFPSRRD